VLNILNIQHKVEFNSSVGYGSFLLNPLKFIEFDGDQARELVNTRQRYLVWRQARERLAQTKGSMVWHRSARGEYLVKSYYEKSGVRKQRSLGRRSPETEALKREFETGRAQVQERFAAISETLKRQAAVNRALGLGRVPRITADILRALDDTGALGHGLRVVGTNAVFAYEAAAALAVDASLTTTEDIDLLFDSRAGLRFIVSGEVAERSLINVLRKVDRSFERTRQTFRAANADGYLVDLIKPMRNPPWKEDRSGLSQTEDDLVASEIEGLVWLESAPAFEAVVIDERGAPLRLVTVDPRAWAAHKWWISKRPDRDPVKRRRDHGQAELVGALVAGYLPHLDPELSDLRMLPLEVVQAAAPLFVEE
jgi:hypothetical protein